MGCQTLCQAPRRQKENKDFFFFTGRYFARIVLYIDIIDKARNFDGVSKNRVIVEVVGYVSRLPRGAGQLYRWVEIWTPPRASLGVHKPW